MSSHHLTVLAERKAELVSRAAAQRAAITEAAGQLQDRMRVIDRGVSALGAIKAHPVLAGVGVAVLLVLSRRTLMRWAGRAVMLWRGWRMLQSMWHGRRLVQ